MASKSSVMVPKSKAKAKDKPIPLGWKNTPPVDLGTVLWTTPKYKDCDIIIEGDQVLRVHKCVLASSSPVFATMFQSQSRRLTETGQTGQLKIQNFNFETVQIAIQILYSHRFASNYSTPVICDLLRFGQKYNIGHLLNACLSQINDLRDSYSSSEKEFLIKSAESLESNRILNYIETIFFERKFGNDYFACLTGLGDVLFQVEAFKDLKIIVEDGTEFTIHKCILGLKSLVFAQEIDKLAGHEQRILMNEIKPAIFEKVIGFMYTGHVITCTTFGQHDLNVILQLLTFADKFRVGGLVSFCLQIVDQFKLEIGPGMMSTWIETAVNFGSKKIFHLILGIFGTRRFDPVDFDINTAPEESYWN